MMDNLIHNINLDNRIPVIHQYIYRKIINRESKKLVNIPLAESRISREDISQFLYDCMIPKQIQDDFLKEMEGYGLIKLSSRRTIEIIRK